MRLLIRVAAFGLAAAPALRGGSAFQQQPLPQQRSTVLVGRPSTCLAASTLEAPAVQAVVAANTGLGEVCFVDEDVDGNACVEFPPALSAPQRVLRALTFYSRVLPVLGAYKIAQVKLERQANAGVPASEEKEAAMWKQLDEWGSNRISDTIKELRGFYVKTGQVISTRVDLFPEAYTEKLATLQDSLEPMDADLVEAIVRQELLEGEPLSSLFSSFEREPLGAASIAQVHKATLLDGREVAVKVQRPNVVPMLLGDISNLKSFALRLRESLPVDYYTVFCELGRALEYELDFLHVCIRFGTLLLDLRPGYIDVCLTHASLAPFSATIGGSGGGKDSRGRHAHHRRRAIETLADDPAADSGLVVAKGPRHGLYSWDATESP
jgi:hypothetical protein